MLSDEFGQRVFLNGFFQETEILGVAAILKVLFQQLKDVLFGHVWVSNHINNKL